VPDRVALQVRASIWGEVAFRLGWLTVDPDRVRSQQSLDEASTNLREAIDHDLAGRDLPALIGTPSISGKSWIGVVDEDCRWVHVHLSGWQEPSEAHPEGRSVGTEEAMVVAVCTPAGSFTEALGLTPFGRAKLT
jgi:hypothetical protein